MKLVRFPVHSPLPIAALTSMSRVPGAPLRLAPSRTRSLLRSQFYLLSRFAHSLHSTCRVCHLCRSPSRTSIEARSLPSSLIAYPCDFALMTRTSRPRASYPSCVTVYPRESRSGVFYVADPSAPFTHSYTRALLPSQLYPFMSLFPFAPFIGLGKGAKIVFMGHNKGRDNARKRAKRRKKHERLASAKKKQPTK